MSRPIDIPKKGPKAWRRVAKQVSDRLEADKPVAGDNISIRELPSGRQINGKAGGGSINDLVEGAPGNLVFRWNVNGAATDVLVRAKIVLSSE